MKVQALIIHRKLFKYHMEPSTQPSPLTSGMQTLRLWAKYTLRPTSYIQLWQLILGDLSFEPSTKTEQNRT